VGDAGHDGTELDPLLHHWTQEERNEEQREQDGAIPHHRSNGDEGNADQRTGLLAALGIGERLDEHVRDDEEDGDADRKDDLRPKYVAPACSRDVS